MIDKKQLYKLIETALAEDINTGDITTMSTVPKDKRVSGHFIAKAQGVLCGLDIAAAVFHYIDTDVTMESHFKDGNIVKNGDIIAAIEGRATSVLTGERLALNMLQRLSGIATKTSEAVSKVSGFPVKILDTRKTTPGLRIFEKYAVRTGGGYNHRFSLSDGVLIKDNHINAAGGIREAIEASRSFVPHTLKIEVEVETLDQVTEALAAGADIIMLDNMTIKRMKQAIQIIDKNALVEASGNMGEKDLIEVAATGVDFISIGALTNYIKPLDISLKFK
ncbi:MAG: carboxylating nicotinate-nucleotide diphosphorylase [Christensenellales bacterium]|jgi:nicotinate-nucleotide pyrophosphorylase (carboxylating)